MCGEDEDDVEHDGCALVLVLALGGVGVAGG
jgi:hypothetical protein